ncbi:MAG: hypothetical protein IKE53_09285 [Clostridiales bacterium]|nr:hypothetical protein [Clostridiales bacterium]
MISIKDLPHWSDILFAVIGTILCGFGCGLANYAALGMDAIGSFYDGLRNILGFESSQIGTVSYIVSFILFVFLFIAGRKYIHIGSIIYVLFYGIFANLGTMLMENMITSDIIWLRAMIGVLGLLTLFFGLGIFITIDIGVDAFTGVVLWICDVTHKKMETVKILFDLTLAVSGILMGAHIGILTVISIAAGGPVISFFTKRFQKFYFRHKLGSMRSDSK